MKNAECGTEAVLTGARCYDSSCSGMTENVPERDQCCCSCCCGGVSEMVESVLEAAVAAPGLGLEA